MINQAQKNLTTINNNKNILNGNVLTLQRQLSDADDNLVKIQVGADNLKTKLQAATVSFSLAQNAYDQARVAKQTADDAVNKIIVDNRTTTNRSNSTVSTPLVGIPITSSNTNSIRNGVLNTNNSNVYSNAAQIARSLLSGGNAYQNNNTLSSIPNIGFAGNIIGSSTSSSSSNSLSSIVIPVSAINNYPINSSNSQHSSNSFATIPNSIGSNQQSSSSTYTTYTSSNSNSVPISNNLI